MNRSRLAVLTIMALVLVLLAWPAVAHAETDETIERVSVDKTGGDSDGSSQTSSISADGQYVVFGSSATDLVATDANGNTGDIFVRDLVVGTTELVSVSGDEVQGDKVSSQPDISPDGRYVAFQSLADNLVSGDGAYVDIFVRDLAEGTTTLMSRNSDGTAANGDSSRASIAADEERVYVAYDSVATNLVAPGIDTNGATRSIFVSYYWKSDPSTVITTLVDRRTDGSLGINPNGSGNPDISADGCYVAYESFFWNERTPDGTDYLDKDFLWDVFVTEWEADTPSGVRTELVSVKTGGDEVTDQDCLNPSISADGKYIAYESASKELTGDSDGHKDIFRTDWNHDPADMVTIKVSPNKDGGEADGYSVNPAISGDGRYVAFESTASDLVPGDENSLTDIFIRDLADEVTYLVTVNSEGVQGNGKSFLPAITATPGSVFPRVSFYSAATNLVAGVTDGNGKDDVFVSAALAYPEVAKKHGSIRYEQDNEKILYTGAWDTGTNESHSDGSIFSTMDPEASITITFKGTKLDWIGSLGPDMGKVWVSVDGGAPVLVDLSSDTELFQQVVWSTGILNYGVHVIEIYFPEDLEADEIKPISIDALDIYGGYLMKTEEPKESEKKSK